MKSALHRILIICMSIWAIGCVSAPVPQVDQVYPLLNETVQPNGIQSLSVSYDASIVEDTVRPDTIQLYEMNGSGRVASIPGTTSYDAAHLTLSFVFGLGLLKPNTTYEAVVSDGLFYNDGIVGHQSFDSSYSWTFNTGIPK